ncbi:TPA: hypothetical protein H1005_03515 [archaeon]|uniref:Uncharacterized protein n=1 Tax=Candidatus Naiadarchaeum limnaeum TaxID=2756139 RepID=A0A832XGF9_9ARCH|nr:hypothetical protein [Candidatus Naiadarchaeales archaeon SRR2090153.bin1042]HIK00144.1 hypothetical protein [Candidatus Naiadarchaeum limnaeum]
MAPIAEQIKASTSRKEESILQFESIPLEIYEGVRKEILKFIAEELRKVGKETTAKKLLKNLKNLKRLKGTTFSFEFEKGRGWVQFSKRFDYDEIVNRLLARLTEKFPERVAPIVIEEKVRAKLTIKFIPQKEAVLFSGMNEVLYEKLLKALAEFIAEQTKKHGVPTPKEYIIKKLREGETFIPYGYRSSWKITKQGGRAVIETLEAASELYELRNMLKGEFGNTAEIKEG